MYGTDPPLIFCYVETNWQSIVVESSHGNQKVGDEEIIDAIESIPEPVASASDVAAQVPLTQTAVTIRLNSLKKENLVDRKNVGSGYVWWVVD